VKLDAAGTHLWSQHFGGPAFDESGLARFAAGGLLYVGGGYRGPVNFGGGTIYTDGLYLLRILP
jgi:hypothetical protein